MSGDHLELVPADNADAYDQVVDLSLDHAAVTTGGLTVDGTDTTDGQPLAIVGVRVPGGLIAGGPAGDLLVPATLTPADVVIPSPDDWAFIPLPDSWLAGDVFIAQPDSWLAGTMSIPEPDEWLAGTMFIPSPDQWLAGNVFIPQFDEWDPAGRLLFADGMGTDVLVDDRADITMILGDAWPTKATPGGLSVRADGGSADGAVALCGGRFGARLGHGDGGGFQCGSLHPTTLTGEIEVDLDDGTRLIIPAGASVDVEELGDGGWEVTVAQGGPVTVIADGAETILDEGDTWPPAIENQPPVADAGGPYLGVIDTPIALDASASSDPDSDTLTYLWTSADGDLADDTDPTPTFTATAAGIYAVTLEVCDVSACDTAEASVVVYDPDGGFVTGGGWIDSQPDSCGPAAPEGVCDDDPTGKASFGFVANYKKGASAPDGQTAFAFQAADLRFHSDSYDWLVVAGKDRAQFRGTGSINGETGHSFLLTASDGGTTAPDGFRIKIWNELGIVYDSRSGADDAINVGNTQVIGGGSIVITSQVGDR